LLPLEGEEHYVFVGAHDILSDARPAETLPDGSTAYIVENQFNPDLLPACIGRLVVTWTRPLRRRYLKAETAGPDLQLVALRERPFGAEDVRFPGFQSFHWTFADLVENVAHPLVAWKSALASVAGVYAITDRLHGVTYLGSAYGRDGIWGRWVGYANSQHNDNKLLKRHVEAHGADGFVFSVLLTMDLSSKKDDVIAKESFFKRALGTRVHGLNDN
ncbi:MAG: GIY-YIG nuclease family protein, partial [Myxococcales bacterium]|nr:GIY-YIG nuclease family protein [Myxococcales bacterium]